MKEHPMNLHHFLSSNVLNLTEAQLAELPPLQLQHFDSELNQAITALDTLRTRLDGALVRRYGQTARQLRLTAGKDFGVVHLDDGPLRITVDVPKRVTWDQDQLADLVTRIRAAGEDPAEYVETTFRVPESRFTAWPEHLRAQFANARTVKPGKASFRLALLPAGGAK
jgi:hypothetical protein